MLSPKSIVLNLPTITPISYIYDSYLKNCESSNCVLAAIVSIVTRAVLLVKHSYQLRCEHIYVGTKTGKFPLPAMDMLVRVLGSVRVLAFFWMHYQKCTKPQGTNLCKLPVLVMRPKEEVQY
jgi:hypothetical protein